MFSVQRFLCFMAEQLLDYAIFDELVRWVEDPRRTLVLIGHNRVNVALEVGQHRKPDLNSTMIALKEHFIVCQAVIVQEEARCDVECNENVYRVVLMSAQNKEEAEHI